MKKIISFAIGCIFSNLIYAGNSQDNAQVNAQFIDLSVTGLHYQSGQITGFTDNTNPLLLRTDSNVIFSIGVLKFESITATNKMRLLDLAGPVSTNNIALINTSNLLISIDEDLDLTNGIQISKEMHTLFNDINVDLNDEHFSDIINGQLKKVNRLLLSKQNNIQSLIDIYYPAFECETNQSNNKQKLESTGEKSESKSGSKIGQTAQLKTLHHRVSGQIEILNDCTLRITDFTYDGKGPDTFFYVARDGDYKNGSQVGDQLKRGQSYKNNTLLIKIDQLDDFNSISVWCEDFSVNFGDGFFKD
ncbi:MAG: DM13 domain-containing protein [Saccharospirillaceae bacterium]|nr:DM13 domain-containing protein [Pseudomonadales bacterium]NRB79546.1 DM13 domain-containing protein [Saccharospirillaceae bacterium]